MGVFYKLLGARAKIYLDHSGDIEEIAYLISSRLLIPEFRIESDQDPPHGLSGVCESLRSNIWLNYFNDDKDFHFEVTIETELNFEESFNDQVYNISLWFARYVSEACELTTFATDIDGKNVYFKNGELIYN